MHMACYSSCTLAVFAKAVYRHFRVLHQVLASRADPHRHDCLWLQYARLSAKTPLPASYLLDPLIPSAEDVLRTPRLTRHAASQKVTPFPTQASSKQTPQSARYSISYERVLPHQVGAMVRSAASVISFCNLLGMGRGRSMSAESKQKMAALSH